LLGRSAEDSLMPACDVEHHHSDPAMTLRRLLSPKVLGLALAVYWLALFTSTHVPARCLGQVQIWDKLAHFVSYAVLTLLLVLAVAARRPLTWVTYGWVLLVVALYGAVDEIGQKFVPGRTADVQDWLADLLGAVLGLAACGLLRLMMATWRASRRSP